MPNDIKVSVEQGDALSLSGDVLALKYAQHFYGLDEVVSRLLIESGVELPEIKPSLGKCRLVESPRQISAKQILFVGVTTLYDFSYRQIRDFSRRVLSELSPNEKDIKSVILSLHGIGYGLDENEAFAPEIAGLADAIKDGYCPQSMQQIIIVERNTARVQRLNILLEHLIPGGVIASKQMVTTTSSQKLADVGYDSDSKAHVFVAMPFKEELDDVYHYGIKGAVNSAGYLCERADHSVFTGDVMAWVKQRINSATLVVADLTDSNPNVYLEVGYAWGRDIPVVLIVNDRDSLGFDVKSQRCLEHKRIKDLEKMLAVKLIALNGLSSQT